MPKYQQKLPAVTIKSCHKRPTVPLAPLRGHQLQCHAPTAMPCTAKCAHSKLPRLRANQGAKSRRAHTITNTTSSLHANHLRILPKLRLHHCVDCCGCKKQEQRATDVVDSLFTDILARQCATCYCKCCCCCMPCCCANSNANGVLQGHKVSTAAINPESGAAQAPNLIPKKTSTHNHYPTDRLGAPGSPSCSMQGAPNQTKICKAPLLKACARCGAGPTQPASARAPMRQHSLRLHMSFCAHQPNPAPAPPNAQQSAGGATTHCSAMHCSKDQYPGAVGTRPHPATVPAHQPVLRPDKHCIH